MLKPWSIRHCMQCPEGCQGSRGSRLVLHFRSSLTYFGAVGGTEFSEEFGEVVAGEFPFEGTRCCLPVILKIQEAFGDGVEIGKIVGG